MINDYLTLSDYLSGGMCEILKHLKRHPSDFSSYKIEGIVNGLYGEYKITMSLECLNKKDIFDVDGD